MSVTIPQVDEQKNMCMQDCLSEGQFSSILLVPVQNLNGDLHPP